MWAREAVSTPWEQPVTATGSTGTSGATEVARSSFSNVDRSAPDVVYMGHTVHDRKSYSSSGR